MIGSREVGNSASLWKLCADALVGRTAMNTMNTTTQISVIKIRLPMVRPLYLPKLNARSIDDPADPVKLPLRP